MTAQIIEFSEIYRRRPVRLTDDRPAVIILLPDDKQIDEAELEKYGLVLEKD